MKKIFKRFIIFGVAISLIAFWFFGTRNDLIIQKANIEIQFSQIERALQKRSNTIPDIISVINDYSQHDETIFAKIDTTRSDLTQSIKSKNPKNIIEAYNDLNSDIDMLMLISTYYPELKSDGRFINLQDELAETENGILVVVNCYNEKVSNYNRAVQGFPTSIVAGISGYYPMEYFETDNNSE